MPLSWNEIKDRALAFSKEWKDERAERAEAQSFWNEFFDVFGVKRRRVAVYEKAVEKLSAKRGRIDAFWPGTLLVEHKSYGEDLDAAFRQATDYFHGLKDAELPAFVVVSDFARFRLYDLDEHQEHEFALADFHQHIALFGFIAGYRKQVIREQDPINVEAVQKMGDLHDLLKQDGYTGHALELFLVRLLFCLFADDTGIFLPKDSFRDLIETFPSEDGSNLGETLERLFYTLNTPLDKRQKSLAEHYAQFPYVNGKLFEDLHAPPIFNSAMREVVLELCGLQWGAISPAIFGAMFQSVIELSAKDRRRQLGAHYTSEANILKLIQPLFLDDLRAEFEKVRRNKNQLFEFHKKLKTLTFLDPACGCGNFLVIAYRELRRLELDVLRAAEQFGQRISGVFALLSVDVDQFYGIEIEEFPAQVAQVAMWLMDHQMNTEAAQYLGEPVLRIPLQKTADIRLGNALRIDWEAFVPSTKLKFIMGNPPFIGKQYQTPEQKEDLQFVADKVKGSGVLDYVTGWYFKAAQYVTSSGEGLASRGKHTFTDISFGSAGSTSLSQRKRPSVTKRAALPIEDMFVSIERAEAQARERIRCAFVSTNSISQGEQVGILWSALLTRGIKIHFAHRTFQWTNEAPGKAAVHCVIIGFGAGNVERKRLFDYIDIKGPAHEVLVDNINPYLVDAVDVVLPARRLPICSVPEMLFGSKPTDGGNLLLSKSESKALVIQEPMAEQYLRTYLSAEEFINGNPRFCLWLKECPPELLSKMPAVLARVDGVRKFRLASKKEDTRSNASISAVFAEDRQPTTQYLAIPKTSSERRAFIPMGFLGAEVVVASELFTISDASHFELGVLSSTMHMAWVRYTCGRLESRYRYSAGIVYNNFPWPDALTDAHKQVIEAAVQDMLDARAAHAGSSLADLYDPLTMPPDLVRAHQKLDAAVDAAYAKSSGRKSFKNDAERVAFLFELYQKYTSLLPVESSKPKRARKIKSSA